MLGSSRIFGLFQSEIEMSKRLAVVGCCFYAAKGKRHCKSLSRYGAPSETPGKWIEIFLETLPRVTRVFSMLIDVE